MAGARSWSLGIVTLLVLAGRAPAGELAAVRRTTKARATASASSASRGQALHGDTYAVYRRQGDWVEVQFSDQRAWLPASDVTVRAAALKRVTARALNVRVGPDARRAVLGTLPKGAQVAERGGDGTWRKISFRGKTAWVHGDFLASEREAAADADAARDDSNAGSEPATTTDERERPTSRSRAEAWDRGRRLGPIDVVTIDGKPVAAPTADAFLRMRDAAARDGVALRVVSGFRSNEEQAELYRRYQAGQGNLAARPGYSNHQNGLALDLNTSSRGVYAWLNRNAGRFGFRRTVPSEAWHWELR